MKITKRMHAVHVRWALGAAFLAATPAHVLSFGEHGLDQPAAFTNLACARLWNVPASAIASERKAACGNTPPPPDTDCEAPRKCSSEALAVIAAWEKAQAPFTLR